MKIEDALKKFTREQLKELSRQDLIELLMGEQEIRHQLELQRQEAEEEKIIIEEKYVLIKRKIFGIKSEKTPSKKKEIKNSTDKKSRDNFSKNLHERYPNIERREETISLETLPTCTCCQSTMIESGMTEDSEYLTVEPKKYILVTQKRQKYRCGSCHGSIQTAPGLPRITPGSSYGDEVILDVSLSKYCDLLPVERYVNIADRLGVKNLPANSLIGLTHSLSVNRQSPPSGIINKFI
jgi:transposase